MTQISQLLFDNVFARDATFVDRTTGEFTTTLKNSILVDFNLANNESRAGSSKRCLESLSFPSSNNEFLLGEPLNILSLNIVPQTIEQIAAVKDKIEKSNHGGNYPKSKKISNEKSFYLDTLEIAENFDDDLNVRAHYSTSTSNDVYKRDVSSNKPETMESLDDSDVEMLLHKTKITQPETSMKNNADNAHTQEATFMNGNCTKYNANIILTTQFLQFGDSTQTLKFESDLVDCKKIANYSDKRLQSDFLVLTFANGKAQVIGIERNKSNSYDIKLMQTIHLENNSTVFNQDKAPQGLELRNWKILVHAENNGICVFYSLQTSQIKIYEIDQTTNELAGKSNMWLKNHDIQMIEFFQKTFTKESVAYKEPALVNSTIFNICLVTTFENKNFSIILDFHTNISDPAVKPLNFQTLELLGDSSICLPFKSTTPVPLDMHIVAVNQKRNGFCVYNLAELLSANSSNINCLNISQDKVDVDNNYDNDGDNGLGDYIKTKSSANKAISRINFIKKCDRSIFEYWSKQYPVDLADTVECFTLCTLSGHVFIVFIRKNKSLLFGILTKVKGINDIVLSVESDKSVSIWVSSKFGFVHTGKIHEFVHKNESNKGDLFLSSWKTDVSIKNFSNVGNLTEVFCSVPTCDKLMSISKPNGGSSTIGSLLGHELWSFDKQHGITQFFYNRNCIEFEPIVENKNFLSFNKFFRIKMVDFKPHVIDLHFKQYIEDVHRLGDYVLMVFTDSIARTVFYVLDTCNWEFTLVEHLESLMDTMQCTKDVQLYRGEYLVRVVGSFKTSLKIHQFRNDGTVEDLKMSSTDQYGEVLNQDFGDDVDMIKVSSKKIACVAPFGHNNCLFICDIAKGGAIFRKTRYSNGENNLLPIEHLETNNELNGSFILSNGKSVYTIDDTEIVVTKPMTGSDPNTRHIKRTTTRLSKKFSVHNKIICKNVGTYCDDSEIKDIRNFYSLEELMNDNLKTDCSGKITYNPYKIHFWSKDLNEIFDVKLNLRWNPKNHMIFSCNMIDDDHLGVLFDDNFYIFEYPTDRRQGTSLQRIMLKKFVNKSNNNNKTSSESSDIFEYCDKINRVIFFQENYNKELELYGIKLHHNMNKMCKIDDNRIFSRNYFSKKRCAPPLMLKVYPSIETESYNVLVAITKKMVKNIEADVNDKKREIVVFLQLILLIPSTHKIRLRLLLEIPFLSSLEMDPFGDNITIMEIPEERTTSNNCYKLIWLYNEKTNMVKVLRLEQTCRGNNNNHKEEEEEEEENHDSDLKFQVVSNYNWKLPYDKKVKKMTCLSRDRLLICFEDNCLNVLEHRLKIQHDNNDCDQNLFNKYMYVDDTTLGAVNNKRIPRESHYNYEFNDTDIDSPDLFPTSLNVSLTRQTDANGLSIKKEIYKITELYVETQTGTVGNIEFLLPLHSRFHFNDDSLICTINLVANDMNLGQIQYDVLIKVLQFTSSSSSSSSGSSGISENPEKAPLYFKEVLKEYAVMPSGDYHNNGNGEDREDNKVLNTDQRITFSTSCHERVTIKDVKCVQIPNMTMLYILISTGQIKIIQLLDRVVPTYV